MITMKTLGLQFNIPVVKAFEGSTESMQDLLDQVGPMVGCEGFVVRFDDGHMIKVKAEDYLRKHKAKDTLCREKNVIELIVTEKLDDVKAFMDAADLKRVEEFEKAFWLGIRYVADELVMLRYVAKDQGLDVDRKTYAVEFVKKQDARYAPFLFKLYDDWSLQNSFLRIKDVIEKSCGTQSKIDEVRWMFNCSWNVSTIVDAD